MDEAATWATHESFHMLMLSHPTHVQLGSGGGVQLSDLDGAA